jgi:diguanylate cyclase (GGDEF)-like protein
MSLLSWFDNRTLLSCQFLLACVFSVVFFGIRRTNPKVHGIGFIVLSFVVGVPGILLLFLRGAIPDLLSMTVANSLVLASYTLQFLAVTRFLGVRRSLYPILIADAAALTVVFYYSQIQHNIVPRIIVTAIAVAFVRGRMALELLRFARRRPYTRLFGLVMTVFALMSCCRAIVCYLHGAPSDYMQAGALQTIATAGDLIYICILGLFFFSMVSAEVLAQIKDQSERDSVSDALNRRGIELKLAIELKRVERSGQRLSVALIDIDHFKNINDSKGHAAGDAALREVVTVISAQLRAYDYLGRYGGDEFLLILPQTSSIDALVVAERINQAVRSFFSLGKTPHLTISIGLSEATPAEQSATLLARADLALYEAKHAGRNCTRVVLHHAESLAELNEHHNGPLPLVDVMLPPTEHGLIQP